jgi:RNA methyltransferase, TrmH family
MLSKTQLKQLQSLHLKKQREAKKLFFAEGAKIILEIMEQKPDCILQIFATIDFIEKHHALLQEKKIQHFLITNDELKKISLQSTPNQALAICRFFEDTINDFDFSTNFSLYLDDVRDPGNLGTIIRVANWFGIQAIFCSPNTCDVYNPKVIQATMGAFLRVNIVYAELSNVVKTHQIKNIYGALLSGNNVYNQKLSPGLIVIGNEANGISDNHLHLITTPLKIPGHPTQLTESLNAAVAASIITAEFFRQLQNNKNTKH